MRYLVDTNVFSEKLKKRPNSKVLKWLVENESELCVSTITIAEIRRGIDKLPEGKRRSRYETWLSELNFKMRGTILGFDRAIAHVWGQMQANLDRKGIRLQQFDSIIAATAVRKNLTVVTRNVKDFENAPVRLLNPFDANAPETEE